MTADTKYNVLKEILIRTRSVRRFCHAESVAPETLNALVELTRYCPSGANRQPLKFLCLCEKEDCRFVTEHLKWAALLPDWEGPSEEEMPAAYILILLDRELAESAPYDSGIAAHAILLGASEQGLGGCMFGSVDREALYGRFGIYRERYRIDLAVALGKPAEEPYIEEAKDSTAYYRDPADRHHVPKRPLSELLYGGGK